MYYISIKTYVQGNQVESHDLDNNGKGYSKDEAMRVADEQHDLKGGDGDPLYGTEATVYDWNGNKVVG